MSAGNLRNRILYKDGYLEKLITDNYEPIYKYCCRHLNQRQAAEDITQETVWTITGITGKSGTTSM